MQPKNPLPPRIGFIGAGRVAKALAWGFAQRK
jgi:pyrroline-5-carboxylate reductase